MTPLLLALAALLPQDSPELLPTAPAGWRFERLEFPLSFAPALDHEGFEEILFTPGMFDPESDSYWSYVLALRIEEDVAVDEAFVSEFLEHYYLGLCESVGKSRELDLDLSGFEVLLEREDARFMATIHMVDPFVTTEALELRLELDVHAGARATELFGAASPLDPDAPVWKELRDLRERWLAARDVPAFLNHLYVIPDPETYAALRDADFLRQAFAVSEQRTTERRDTSYTGVYFYGDSTYFEFLQPDAAAGFAQGNTGLAFGFEQRGGTQRIAAGLEEAGITTFQGSITRAHEGEQVPWFEIMGIERPTSTSTLNMFSLEYVPAFLDTWHAGLEPAGGGVSRAAVMRRYAASLGRRREEALFRDVSVVHLALDAAELDRLVAVCRTFGYAVEEQDGVWRCDGPQVDLILSPSDTPGGITSFVVSLRKTVEREPLQLGKARLTFEGARATFTFTD